MGRDPLVRADHFIVAGKPLPVSGGKGEVSPAASLNYSVAKVAAILTVVAGHWFTGTILWIPATFGLFIFAFSSGYFTTKIYGAHVDRGRFWRRKLERLGLRFWVILAFLMLVVAVKGKTVLHWHTLVHFAGLSGVLNWTAVPNRSGLGAGLWFFTLLLGFYLVYPYLARITSSRKAAVIIALACTVAAIFFEENVKVGHELWLTALGFILGVAFAMQEPTLRGSIAGLAALGLGALLFFLNAAAGYNGMNTVLIALTSIALAVWLARAELLRSSAVILFAKLDTYLLEIFLIHTYLFVHPTGISLADFSVSLLLIIASSIAVHHLADVIAAHVFVRSQRPVRKS
jgi:hypothetical protein